MKRGADESAVSLPESPSAFDAVHRQLTGDPVHDFRVIETHLSRVFVVDELVFKFKKNVKHEFVDQTTLKVRIELCEKEIVANSSGVARGVYLGLGRFHDGAVVLRGNSGEPCVIMRRLNDEDSFEAVLSRGEDVSLSELRRLAQAMKKCFSVERTTGTYGHLRKLMIENFEFPSAVLGKEDMLRLKRASLDLHDSVELRPPWLDGHGDLKAEHVYRFDDRLVVIDRVEFRDDFRLSPGFAQDVATLVVDFRIKGRYDLAKAFSSLFDDVPSSWLRLFVCYRAAVKAKICALRSSESHKEQKACWNVVEHALGGAGAAKFFLVVTTADGKPGCGKSTLARNVAASFSSTNVCVIGTDSIREEIGLCGEYDDESKFKVYNAAIERASDLALANKAVVLEGNFPSTTFAAIRSAAIGCGLPVVAITIECEDAIARERVAHRHAEDSTEVRDGQRFDRIVAKLKARTDHDPSAKVFPVHLTVSTSHDSPRAVCAKVVDFLRESI